MGKKIETGKSKGIFEGLNFGNKEEKKESNLEVSKESILDANKDDTRVKRGYMLLESTVKKLERMKLEDFPSGTSLESIVEKAIIEFYENNHK